MDAMGIAVHHKQVQPSNGSKQRRAAEGCVDTVYRIFSPGNGRSCSFLPLEISGPDFGGDNGDTSSPSQTLDPADGAL